VSDQRRGARGNSSVKWRTVNAYISDWNRRLNWSSRDHDRRSGQLCEIDVHLRHRCAGHADTDYVPTGVAGICLYCHVVIVYRCGVMAPVNERRMLMIVGGWPVVMVGMIVPQVLVYVQRRAHSGRRDQGLGEHQCDEPAHEKSLLRLPYRLRKPAGLTSGRSG
jgi:hypothetical protein